MSDELETGECASCGEPISAWDWVKTPAGEEPWCGLCALIHAGACEICRELCSSAWAYRITRGGEDTLVCPDDLMPWCFSERLSPAKKLLVAREAR